MLPQLYVSNTFHKNSLRGQGVGEKAITVMQSICPLAESILKIQFL